ncbi:hypothetical protein BMS3Abin03_00975 [bacterium BMS3Abin03]|nr:hypothetical protein BMS3Abin03_00975 [bacterium BMS3Abin03]
MTKKNKLPDNHNRSLSVTSRIIERTINEMEFVLNGIYKNNIAEVIEPSYTKKERDEILKLLTELKEENENMSHTLELKPDTLIEDWIIFAQLSYLWTILIDSKSNKLKRYGDLPQDSVELIDNFIEKLLTTVEKIKQVGK